MSLVRRPKSNGASKRNAFKPYERAWVFIRSEHGTSVGVCAALCIAENRKVKR